MQRPFVRNMEQVAIPESTFISAARDDLVNGTSSSGQASSSTIRQGELASRLLALQAEKNRAMEERKIDILEAQYTARIKKAEEAAVKRAEQEKRKAELAAARALQVAEAKEKKRQEAELNKKAKAESRRIILEVRKEVAEKKQEAALRKQAEKQKRDMERGARNAANRARIQQEARDRAQLMETLQAAKRSEGEANDEDDFVSPMPVTKKVNMMDELRNPRDV
jgi:hypothetical protein